MEKTPPKQFHLMGKMRDTLNEVHFILTPKEEITILYLKHGKNNLTQMTMYHKHGCEPMPSFLTTGGLFIPAYGEFTNAIGRDLMYNLRLQSCLFYDADGYPQSVVHVRNIKEYFSVGTISDKLLAGIPTDLAKTAF